MISEKIIQKANELILADARRNVFPRQLIVDTVLSDKDVVWLLNSAGMLAFGNEVERKLAYEIATRAINFIATPAAALLAKSVLVRLGIFPGAELIAERSLDEIQSPTLALTEEAANRAEAYISVAGQDYYLSPFQRAAFHTMQSHRFSSISAPTSAGKSLVTQLHIAKVFQDRGSGIIAYIVPTRALIRETAIRLRRLLRVSAPSCIIVTTPEPPQTPNQSVVYVLTQERLLTLCISSNIEFDALYVDEAQEIGEGSRGIILQDALEHVLRSARGVRVCFIAPLVRNPDVFTSLSTDPDWHTFSNDEPPVTQNIYTIRKAANRKKAIDIGLIIGGQEVTLGQDRLLTGLSSLGLAEQLAEIAFHFSRIDDRSIVYSPNPADADRVAMHLAKKMRMEGRQDVTSDKLDELTMFLREYVHPEYELLDAFRAGVAVHYGRMPSIVRARIEDLVSDGVLRFVACTSTLLQGVNLPARNLFLARAKMGSDKS